MAHITSRFSDAVEYAREAHKEQFRKGSGVPYLYHLLAVASLVLEHGGSEDQAIAALLHDVIEDCGVEHASTIRHRYGDVVADIVYDCTDGTAEDKQQETSANKKAKWRERKERCLEHLAKVPNDTLLVSACDKLHNARAILQDLQDPAIGTQVFDRFTGERNGTLWYYRSLVQIFEERQSKVHRQLRETVDHMHALAI